MKKIKKEIRIDSIGLLAAGVFLGQAGSTVISYFAKPSVINIEMILDIILPLSVSIVLSIRHYKSLIQNVH
ncbi:MAG: hypothetical protein KDD58_02200 [Bdellovibrionales bacterium]|nr:hypothetical protein [Bdellovibrionales bacterium]